VADGGLIRKISLMNPIELKTRTKTFAVGTVKLADKLPDLRAASAIARQFVRSGMSAGANYRAACRAQSRADFISKLGTVEEKRDETLYWMELLVEPGKMQNDAVHGLMNEATQILPIVVASISIARSNGNPPFAIRNSQSR
jgi:four helix bundle protein